jgi:hypothetical protein
LTLIDTLSGCLTEYWLVLLKSFEVLLSALSSSHIVNDWHMIIGDELVDDEDEDVLRTNFFSLAGSLLAPILAVVSRLYEEDEDKETLGDMLLDVVVLAVVVMSGMVHLDEDDEDRVDV